MKNLNTDDIFFRNLTISLLDLLNRKFTIEQKVDDITENRSIPFFYNFGNDEQFMKDFFIGIPDDCVVPKAEGNHDQVPRGIVTYTGASISTSDITNKFVRGNYSAPSRGVNDERKMDAYSAFLFAIPFQATYSVEIKTSTLNQSFKIMEMILELYANRVMYFQFKGMRIPAQFKFPKSQQLEKQTNFDYTVDQMGTIKFQITVETYYPSFNRDSIRNRKNIMEQIGFNFKAPGGFQYISGWHDQGDETTTS